jgi:hypothetical protein
VCHQWPVGTGQKSATGGGAGGSGAWPKASGGRLSHALAVAGGSQSEE